MTQCTCLGSATRRATSTCTIWPSNVVGGSRPRHDATFGGLVVHDELTRRHAQPQCGLQVIDLNSSDVVHWLRIEGEVSELCDVAVLPGVVRPMALGFKTNEIQRLLAVDDEGKL
jgi:uncharacterized protein (TIGR03032 family)